MNNASAAYKQKQAKAISRLKATMFRIANADLNVDADELLVMIEGYMDYHNVIFNSAASREKFEDFLALQDVSDEAEFEYMCHLHMDFEYTRF